MIEDFDNLVKIDKLEDKAFAQVDLKVLLEALTWLSLVMLFLRDVSIVVKWTPPFSARNGTTAKHRLLHQMQGVAPRTQLKAKQSSVKAMHHFVRDLFTVSQQADRFVSAQCTSTMRPTFPTLTKIQERLHGGGHQDVR